MARMAVMTEVGAVADISNRTDSHVDAGLAASMVELHAEFWSGRRIISVLFASVLILWPVFNSVAQGQSLIQDKQGWVYVNEKGEAVLRPFIYDNGPDYFEEGLARFIAKGKMGFHDQSLKVWVPARYDFAFPFVGGKAKVGMDCEFIAQDEHGSVHCRHWEHISNPLTASKDQPEN